MKKKSKYLVMVTIGALAMNLTTCGKNEEDVFLDNTTIENRFNIKSEEDLKIDGLKENEIFQSFYSEDGYIYGAIRTLVDSSSGKIIENDIEKKRKDENTYLKLKDNKIYKIDKNGKLSNSDREIWSSEGEERVPIEIVEKIATIRVGNEGMFMRGFSESGYYGGTSLGKKNPENIYKFSDKYAEKIKNDFHPSIQFIDKEEKYLLAVFYDKPVTSTETSNIESVLFIDIEKNKEYKVNLSKEILNTYFKKDNYFSAKAVYNEKNNNFLLINYDGKIDELEIKENTVEIKNNGNFKEVSTFFDGLTGVSELKYISIEDKIVIYKSSAITGERLMFSYNVKTNTGNLIYGNSDFEGVITAIEDSNMFLLRPRGYTVKNNYALVKLEDDNIIKVHSFAISERERLSCVYPMKNEKGEVDSIIFNILNIKEANKYKSDYEAYELKNYFESIRYLKLSL